MYAVTTPNRSIKDGIINAVAHRLLELGRLDELQKFYAETNSAKDLQEILEHIPDDLVVVAQNVVVGGFA